MIQFALATSHPLSLFPRQASENTAGGFNLLVPHRFVGSDYARYYRHDYLLFHQVPGREQC